MARKQSQFVSASGTSFEILKRIADEVMAQGGDDENLRRVLTDDGVVKDIAKVLCNPAPAQPPTHLVNTDLAPFLPDGWKGIETHRTAGTVLLERRGDDLYVNGEKIELFLSERQKGNGRIVGTELRKELADKLVLNANILDYLLAHTELIPESWKGKCVFFWGTEYRGSDGNLCARCLYWPGVRWFWYYYWLDYDFYSDSPAAVSASQELGS